MKRLLFSTLITGSVLLIATTSAQAQGLGVGVGFYAGSGYYGPGIGAYPLYYRGFYGNGMSMYGPPVPTYGIVPGTFGAADYRVNQNAPFLGAGVGWYGYRSPSPRPRINFIPYAPADTLEDREPPLSDRAVSGNLTLDVRLPTADAVVFIDGNPTKQTGNQRQFSSPTLPSGENFHYEIKAEWTENGKTVSRTRIAAGKAGERVVVSFTE